MELGRSYHLQNYVVRVYQSTKYLSRGESAKLTAIEDIGGVVCGGDGKEEIVVLREVSVIGVPEMETFKACLKCKARVEPQSPPLGRCSKTGCTMLQRYDIVKSILQLN